MYKPLNSNAPDAKRNKLFLILCGIFLTNAILAELVGVKIFSAEATLGLPYAHLPLMEGFILDFNLTAGAIIWPVVFITTDVINEYFGVKGVRKISFLTAGLILYVFAVILIVTALEPAAFWLEVNSKDASGNPFNIHFAFNTIFRQSMGIIIGSLTAFLIGQLLDAWVFQKLRSITGSRKIWLRATGSTLVSQLVDSFIVLFIAFKLFGNWSWAQVISVALINYLYKFVAAIALTPLLYVAHYFIDQYLGRNKKQEIKEKSDPNHLPA
jgi:uncharacterized integral membrane protein (TIGR00697 family)